MQTTRNDTSALVTDMIAHPERYPDDLLVLDRDSGFLARAFSKESLRIQSVLRDKGPIIGMSRLAHLLQRDRTRVSKDVHFLEGLGLVWMERRGRTMVVGATDITVWVR